MINLLNPGGQTNNFPPIPLKDILRQYLVNEGDMATVILQAALADSNHNNIFDTAEEYSDFVDRMKKAADNESYSQIDYSALKVDPVYDFDF